VKDVESIEKLFGWTDARLLAEVPEYQTTYKNQSTRGIRLWTILTFGHIHSQQTTTAASNMDTECEASPSQLHAELPVTLQLVHGNEVDESGHLHQQNQACLRTAMIPQPRKRRHTESDDGIGEV
jgi:hypothetical protein